MFLWYVLYSYRLSDIKKKVKEKTPNHHWSEKINSNGSIGINLEFFWWHDSKSLSPLNAKITCSLWKGRKKVASSKGEKSDTPMKKTLRIPCNNTKITLKCEKIST